jgi:membrane-associated protease RseP (regulator of RpoE activity)
MKNHVSVVVVAPLFAAAPAVLRANVDGKKVDKIAAKVTITLNPFTQVVTVAAPQQSWGFPNIYTWSFVGGMRPDGSLAAIQLLVTYWSQTGWMFLSEASDRQGLALPVHPQDQSIEPGANVQEKISIDLYRAYLEQQRDSGLDLQIRGKRGSFLLKIPPEYVQAFTRRFDAEMAARQAAATPVTIAPTPSAPITAAAGAAASSAESSAPLGARVLGVKVVAVPALYAAQFGDPSGEGALVAIVAPGSIAEKLGLRVGDIIIAVGETPVHQFNELSAAVKGTSATSNLLIIRDTARINVPVSFP